MTIDATEARPQKSSEEPSLVDEILAESQIAPERPEYQETRRGVEIVLADVVKRSREPIVDGALVDLLISEIDARMSHQLDEILHHPMFQRLEAAWRGLKFMIDRIDFRENIRVEMLNCSKDDLLHDFEDATEIPKSSMYKIVYSAEFGQFGGRPYAAILANYEFSNQPQDITLLQKCASVATMSHAPFIAGSKPQFFGLQDFRSLGSLSDIKALFEGPQYTKYNAFRDTEDARYVGLVLPRFLLRLPYGAATVPIRSFNYEEDVAGQLEAYCWGSAVFAFGTRVAESFAKYRWCIHIIGPSAGGTVENMIAPYHEALDGIQKKIPTECIITEKREFELGEQGFMALVYRKDTENACFFSANSVQKPKYFGISDQGREAELNFRLGTQLPYMFLVSRLAHYIKVIQREHIGSWKERGDLESELNQWINQYVADMDMAGASVRARKPLRKAKITVSEVPGAAGWYRVDLQIRPHLKYMGAFFSLNLMGKLDKE